MHTTRPVMSVPQTSATPSYANDASPVKSTESHLMSVLRTCYRFLVRRRVPISFISFTLLLTTEGLLGVGRHHVDYRSDVIFGTAVTLVLLGVGVRSWAAGTIRKNSELATSGAYSLCRHPLYLGSFLMIVGFCIATQPQINLPIVAPLVIVIYVCAIRTEELRLAEIFGPDWTKYSAATPRLLPNPLRSQIRLSRWSAKQWRSNREYNAVLGALAGIGGLFAWYAFG